MVRFELKTNMGRRQTSQLLYIWLKEIMSIRQNKCRTSLFLFNHLLMKYISICLLYLTIMNVYINLSPHLWLIKKHFRIQNLISIWINDPDPLWPPALWKNSKSIHKHRHTQTNLMKMPWFPPQCRSNEWIKRSSMCSRTRLDLVGASVYVWLKSHQH